MHAYLAGLGTGLSLIVAIGAQNAFVLKQGLMRRHVLATVAFCALLDAVVIVAGVLGAGAIAARAPWFLETMRWGGAAFLLAYGARSLRAAWRGEAVLRAGEGATDTIGFTSAGQRGKRIGECWSDLASADGAFEIFIVPGIDDAARIAGILTHELVHAAVGLKAGHGAVFAKAARALGLEGKMTATTEGPEWDA